MFSPQIHIVFNSKEEDRIIKPILDNAPNKVYYFTAIIRKTGQKDVNLSFFEANSKELKDNIPSIEIIQKELDYTNYIEIIQEISKIVKKERENNLNSKIYINVSSGSKMTALASVEASKLWNCKIYYVYASKYDPTSKGPMHKGEMIIKTPITFPINKPPELYINILKLIENMLIDKYDKKGFADREEKFIYKKNLVLGLYDKGLLTLTRKNDDARKLTSSLYMKSKKILSILANELKYIEISEDKRNKKILLTDIGKSILEIFKFLI